MPALSCSLATQQIWPTEALMQQQNHSNTHHLPVAVIMVDYVCGMSWHAGLVAGGQLGAALMFVSAHPDALLLIFLLSLAATLGMLILPLCRSGASDVHCCARTMGFAPQLRCVLSCVQMHQLFCIMTSQSVHYKSY